MAAAHRHAVLVVARDERSHGGLAAVLGARRTLRVTLADSALAALDHLQRGRPCVVLAAFDDRDVGALLLRTLMLEAPRLRDVPLVFVGSDGARLSAAAALRAPVVRAPHDAAAMDRLLTACGLSVGPVPIRSGRVTAARRTTRSPSGPGPGARDTRAARPVARPSAPSGR